MFDSGGGGGEDDNGKAPKRQFVSFVWSIFRQKIFFSVFSITLKKNNNKLQLIPIVKQYILFPKEIQEHEMRRHLM